MKSTQPLTEKERDICKVVKDVNLLFQSPLTVDQISKWGVTINKMKPELHIDDLEIAMGKLIVGECEFNPYIGIQNIFIALKSLERPMVY